MAGCEVVDMAEQPVGTPLCLATLDQQGTGGCLPLPSSGLPGGSAPAEIRVCAKRLGRVGSSRHMERKTNRRARASAEEGPLWKRIEEALRAEIIEGAFTDNKLPPEGELAQRFAVNRLTIRQALANLQAGGFISIEPGRGTFVQRDLVTYGLGERVRFSQNLAASRMAASRKFVHADEIEADPVVAQALGLTQGAPVILISVIGEADGVPILYGLHYYNAIRFAGLAEICRQMGSLSKALAAFGVEDYTRGSTELVARMPTSEEARYLGQSKLEPVVETRAVDIDASGAPIAYGVACFAAARVRFVVGSKTC